MCNGMANFTRSKRFVFHSLASPGKPLIYIEQMIEDNLRNTSFSMVFNLIFDSAAFTCLLVFHSLFSKVSNYSNVGFILRLNS
jgi:hypothetical protein